MLELSSTVLLAEWHLFPDMVYYFTTASQFVLSAWAILPSFCHQRQGKFLHTSSPPGLTANWQSTTSLVTFHTVDPAKMLLFIWHSNRSLTTVHFPVQTHGSGMHCHLTLPLHHICHYFGGGFCFTVPMNLTSSTAMFVDFISST